MSFVTMLRLFYWLFFALSCICFFFLLRISVAAVLIAAALCLISMLSYVTSDELRQAKAVMKR